MFGIKSNPPKQPEPPVTVKPVIETPIEPASSRKQRPHTLIGPGIKFVGNIEASEDIEINGRVEGNIASGNTITVTEEGSIRGNIAAGEFILHGLCEGDAKVAGHCEIGEKGCFVGEMFCSTLVTEDGSEFEGTLHLKKARAAPACAAEPEGFGEDVPATEDNIFN
jgi:cytoskeletal protein CcmA (bactofilin family)